MLDTETQDEVRHQFVIWCLEQALHIFEQARPNDKRIRRYIWALKCPTTTKIQRDFAWIEACEAVYETTGIARYVANAAVANSLDDCAYWTREALARSGSIFRRNQIRDQIFEAQQKKLQELITSDGGSNV